MYYARILDFEDDALTKEFGILIQHDEFEIENEEFEETDESDGSEEDISQIQSSPEKEIKDASKGEINNISKNIKVNNMFKSIQTYDL